MGLGLPDQVADGRGAQEHLGARRAAGAVGGGHELLGDHTFEGRGEHHPDLFLLLRGEDVDDAVDRLRCVLGVERAEDEVAGLGGRKGHRDGLEVAELADQDHVGILAQHPT